MQEIKVAKLSDRTLEKIGEGHYIAREADGTLAYTLKRDGDDPDLWTTHNPDGSFSSYIAASESGLLSLIDPGFEARALAAAAEDRARLFGELPVKLATYSMVYASLYVPDDERWFRKDGFALALMVEAADPALPRDLQLIYALLPGTLIWKSCDLIAPRQGSEDQFFIDSTAERPGLVTRHQEADPENLTAGYRPYLEYCRPKLYTREDFRAAFEEGLAGILAGRFAGAKLQFAGGQVHVFVPFLPNHGLPASSDPANIRQLG